MTIHVTEAEFTARVQDMLARVRAGEHLVVGAETGLGVTISPGGDTTKPGKARSVAEWLDQRPPVELIGGPVTREEILEWIREGRK